MENNHENQPIEAENAPVEESYVPRPVWQVWAARLGLVLFMIIVIGQILSIARGGL